MGCKKYVVQLDAVGGDCSINSYTITYDLPFFIETIPTKYGYEFEG